MAGASEFEMPRNHPMCLFNVANANRADEHDNFSSLKGLRTATK